MVIADRGRRLVQEIAAGVGNLGMNLLDFGFRLLPVATGLLLARQSPLGAGKSLLVPPEAVKRFDMTASAQCRETGNPHVDTHNRRRRMHRLFDLALCLDGHKPLTATGRNRDVLGRTEYLPAVPVTEPAEFRQEEATVALVQLEPLWKPKTVVSSFLFESRKVGAFLKEVCVPSLQVGHHLLKCLSWGVTKERKLLFPRKQPMIHAKGIGECFTCGMIRLLAIQRQIPDLAGVPSESTHRADLFAVGLNLKLVGL